MRDRRLACALAAAGLLAAACADLLPKGHEEVASPWHNFDEARQAFERIAPDRTTVADLRAMGIDPFASQNVQLLSYSDILLRFPFNSSHGDRLDGGLKLCLDAGKACTGYSLNVRDVKRDRVGNFWQDTLGFKRVVDVSGWTFNGLILIVGDKVVYTLYGGQPNMREHELERHPLGPLQNIGESAGGLVR